MDQRVLLRGIYILYTLSVILISLLPGSGVSAGQLDKMGHFSAYLGWAVLALLAFKPGLAQILALIFAVLLGAALAWGQSFVPGRDMSLLDDIANSLGAITGSVFYRLGEGQIRGIVDRLIK